MTIAFERFGASSSVPYDSPLSLINSRADCAVEMSVKKEYSRRELVQRKDPCMSATVHKSRTLFLRHGDLSLKHVRAQRTTSEHLFHIAVKSW